MNLKCIAVDDEPLALGLVTSFIEQTPFLELAGQFDNAIEALHDIQSKEVDLVFLDIQMSDLTGIELARLLEKADPRPLVIFTTAFDQFALEGYKVDAIDYLLKPFNYQEFLRAATKAQQHRKLQKSEPTGASQQQEPNYIFLKVEYQLVKVMLDDILYVEGLKDYVKVHLKSKEHPLLTLNSLKAMEEKLPAGKFTRIHRSFIVSIDNVDSISKNSVEIGKTHLTISENYRKQFHELIGSGL